MPTNIGTAFFDVSFNTAAARREITALVSRVNSSFGLIGGVALVGATVAVGGLVRATVELGSSALGAANDYEQAFASVRKTLDDGSLTADQARGLFANLNNELRQIALDTPLDLNDDIAQVASLGGQLGIAAEDIGEFTQVIGEVGVTTNIAVGDAATGIARLINIMGLADSQFRNVGDALVNLGNNVAAQEDEILRFSLRIAAAGEVAGFTYDEVLAIGAAFSAVGVPAERGGTAVQRTMIKIEQAVSTGSEALATFGAVSGLTAEEFAALWEEDASEAFTLFIEGLGQAGPAVFSLLDKVDLVEQRTVQALLSIANAGPLLRDVFELGANSANALSTESGIFFNTTQARIQILKNTINDAGITIGNVLQGPFNDLLDGLIDWIRLNPQLIRQIGENLADALKSIAPLFLDLVDGALKFTESFSGFISDLVGNTEEGVRGMGALEESADFLDRGFSFDPTFAGFLDFFGAAGGVEKLTLVEAALREELQRGAPVVGTLADALVTLDAELKSTGESLSQFGVEEILDEAHLTEEQMRQVVLQAQRMGVVIPPAILEMLELRNVTDSWMNLWRTGLPTADGGGPPLTPEGGIDFDQIAADQAAAAEKAADYAEGLVNIRQGLLDTGFASGEYLDNLNRLDPATEALIGDTERWQVEADLMAASLDNLRNVMEFRPASEGLFGVGDLANGIEEATRILEESGDEVKLHGDDVTKNIIANMNQIAEFEANLIILFARGFDDLARTLAEQGPEFAHIAEDYARGFSDPGPAEAALESGGTLGAETQAGLDAALNSAADNPALLEFAAQMGSRGVLQAVYLEGLSLGETTGEGFRDGFLRKVGGLLGLLGLEVPTIKFPGSDGAGETDIPTQDGGGGGGAGGARVFNLNFSANTTSTEAARAGQIINALVLE